MRAGRFMDVELHINNFFLALLALFFVAGVLGKGLIAFMVVLVHEFAHAAAARRLGVPVADVELLPFGGVTRMGGELVLDPTREVYVAAAGPASNLLMAALGLAMKNYGLWDGELGPFFLQCNFLIAAFNLLPALPLDGGRVYRAHLARRLGVREATYRAAGLGQWWAAAIAVFGSAGLVTGFCGLDVLVTALFLFYAASRERRMAPYLFMEHLVQKKSELLGAGILPAKILVSLEDVPLGEVIRSFLPRRVHLVLVFNRQWQFRGLVTEAQVVDGLMEYGMDLPVGRLPPACG